MSFDSASVLEHVGANSVSSYPEDTVVVSQGDSCDAVFYLQSGSVKLTVLSGQGKEAVIAILNPSDFFGEACLTGEVPRLSTATTLRPSVIFRFAKADIARLIHDNPAFAEVFIAHLLRRTIRVEADLVDQLFNSSEKRLARKLLLLANYGQGGDVQPIIPKLSQETLAGMIGTTRSA